jgi:hypothetical protein
VREQLASVAADGTDVYFDNVGSDRLESVIAAMLRDRRGPTDPALRRRLSQRSQTELTRRQGHHVGDISPTTRTATLPVNDTAGSRQAGL